MEFNFEDEMPKLQEKEDNTSPTEIEKNIQNAANNNPNQLISTDDIEKTSTLKENSLFDASSSIFKSKKVQPSAKKNLFDDDDDDDDIFNVVSKPVVTNAGM